MMWHYCAPNRSYKTKGVVVQVYELIWHLSKFTKDRLNYREQLTLSAQGGWGLRWAGPVMSEVSATKAAQHNACTTRMKQALYWQVVFRSLKTLTWNIYEKVSQCILTRSVEGAEHNINAAPSVGDRGKRGTRSRGLSKWNYISILYIDDYTL